MWNDIQPLQPLGKRNRVKSLFHVPFSLAYLLRSTTHSFVAFGAAVTTLGVSSPLTTSSSNYLHQCIGWASPCCA